MKAWQSPAMRGLLASVVLMCCGATLAAPAPRILSIDLGQLRSEFKTPEQIAIGRPLTLDTASTGTGWQKAADGIYTWSDTIQVPGASNLALHFPGMVLPVGSELTLTNASGYTYTYSPADINSKAFTSVFVPGDTATVTVRAVNPQAVSVRADRVFVGADNPLRAQLTSNRVNAAPLAQTLWRSAAAHPNNTLPSECTTNPYSEGCRAALLVNYACAVDSSTATQSRGVVGITLTQSNLNSVTSCSGTLVNDVPSDGHSYVVTADHCAQDGADLEEPNYSAQEINVYWPRIEGNCGDIYYNTSTNTYPTRTTFYALPASYGPVSNGFTVIAHQDHVLNPHKGDNICDSGASGCVVGADMLLLGMSAAPPEGANPYWAGINAADTTDGDTKVPYGTANPSTGVGDDDPSFGATSFNLSYPLGSPMTVAKDSTYGVKNGLDNFGTSDGVYNANIPGVDGPAAWCADFTADEGDVTLGSSGSALFDATGLLRGLESEGESSAGSTCPDLFYRIDLAWNNTYNGASNALKTYLDPSNTGALQTVGFEDTTRSDNLSVIFGALQDANVAAGAQVGLLYYTAEATSCTASSVPSGLSGWNGTLTVKNKTEASATVTLPASSGAVTLSLTCTNAAGYQKAVSVDIDGGATANTNPSAFTFTVVTGATPGTTVTSNIVTPAGYNSPATVTVSGGTYSVNGGAFTSAAGSISPGQTLQLEATAPAAGQSALVTVTVGTTSASFTVTSAAASSSSSSGGSGSSSSSSGSGSSSSGGSSSGGSTSSGSSSTSTGSSSGGGGGAFGGWEIAGLLLLTLVRRSQLRNRTLFSRSSIT